VVPVTQPAYLFDSGDQYRDLLGPLADELQPWRRLLDAGLRVVISSDSDVSDYRPLETLRHAVLRTSSGGDVLGEDQRLSLEEALFAHTIDAAFACGWEDRVGSIEEGKLADLVILGSGRAGFEPDVLSGSARVVATLVGGDVRFDANGSLAELIGQRP
jgi:predicted amidohydrolase YtcJ